MQLCIDMLDASYIETRHDMYLAGLVSRAIVLLDRQRVKYCIFADEECGFVVVYKQPLQVTNGFIETESIHGKVRIIDPDEEDLLAEAYTRCDRG